MSHKTKTTEKYSTFVFLISHFRQKINFITEANMYITFFIFYAQTINNFPRKIIFCSDNEFLECHWIKMLVTMLGSF